MSRGDAIDAEEFKRLKNGYSLDSYRQALLSLYTDPDVPHGQEGKHLDFGRWNVSEIRTFKNRESVFEHQYLVATLHDTDEKDGKSIRLRIECRIQGVSTPRRNAENTPEKVKKFAVDKISICSSPDLDFDQLPVDHFVFTESRIPLPKLVVLACTINEYGMSYHIASRNCYWFCYVASETLKKCYPHKLIQVGGGSQQGCWHGIPFCPKDVGDIVKNLETKYNEAWVDFTEKINRIINNPNNKFTISARREAEEMKSLAEREARRADEVQRENEKLKRELESLTHLTPTTD